MGHWTICGIRYLISEIVYMINKFFLLVGILFYTGCCRTYNPHTFKENQITKFSCVAEFTLPINGVMLSQYMIESYYTNSGHPLRFWIQDSIGKYKVGQYLTLKP